jgi:hypothetical protein
MKTPRGLNPNYPRACKFIRPLSRNLGPVFWPAPVSGHVRRPVQLKRAWAVIAKGRLSSHFLPRCRIGPTRSRILWETVFF